MDFFTFIILLVLIVLVYFSSQHYKVSLDGPRRIRLFWLGFILLQLCFVFLCLNILEIG